MTQRKEDQDQTQRHKANVPEQRHSTRESGHSSASAKGAGTTKSRDKQGRDLMRSFLSQNKAPTLIC